MMKFKPFLIGISRSEMLKGALGQRGGGKHLEEPFEGAPKPPDMHFRGAEEAS